MNGESNKEGPSLLGCSGAPIESLNLSKLYLQAETHFTISEIFCTNRSSKLRPRT